MIQKKVSSVIDSDINGSRSNPQDKVDHSKLENLAFNVMDQEYDVSYIGDNKDGKPFYQLTKIIQEFDRTH